MPVVVKSGTASGGRPKLSAFVFSSSSGVTGAFLPEAGGGAGGGTGLRVGWLGAGVLGGGGVLTRTGFLPHAVRNTANKTTTDTALDAGGKQSGRRPLTLVCAARCRPLARSASRKLPAEPSSIACGSPGRLRRSGAERLRGFSSRHCGMLPRPCG